jgi:hypothetical protein
MPAAQVTPILAGVARQAATIPQLKDRCPPSRSVRAGTRTC